MIAAEMVEYKTTILCFVNCLILGTEDIWTRHAVRTEMIVLGLLDEIEKMKLSSDNPELLIQIQVFEHHRSKDEDKLDVADERSLFDLFTNFFVQVILFNHIII